MYPTIESLRDAELRFGGTKVSDGVDARRTVGLCLASRQRCLVIVAMFGLYWCAAGSLSAQNSSSASGATIAGDLYQFPPGTPAKMLEAVRTTRALDRIGDARAFLRAILDLQLSDAELLLVRDDVGLGIFIEFAADAGLHPESRELLATLNDAARRRTITFDEIQDALTRLGASGSAGERALMTMLAAGDAAVPVLLSADVSTLSGRAADQFLLVHAQSLRQALYKELSAANDPMRIRILGLLSTTADDTLALRLLKWQYDSAVSADVQRAAESAVRQLSVRSSGNLAAVSTPQDAAGILIREARAKLKAAGSRFSALQQPDSAKELSGLNLRAEAVAQAMELTELAESIVPGVRDVSVTGQIAASASRGISLSDATTFPAAVSVAELLEILEASLDLHPVASIDALLALRHGLSESESDDRAGQVLSRALESPDARIRILAAVIVRESGVNAVRSAVQRTVQSGRSGSLKPEVVIVTADDSELKRLHQIFEDAGYAPQGAETGSDGFEKAAGQMTCELFVIHAESPGWPLAVTLANLRADVRTRETPVVVIGPERFRLRADALRDNYEGVWFVPDSSGAETLLSHLSLLNLPPHALSSSDRAMIQRLAQ